MLMRHFGVIVALVPILLLMIPHMDLMTGLL